MSDLTGNPEEPSDDIARLVRLAGKRRAVPPDRLERVRAAAHAEWQAEVRRGSRRRVAWTAVVLAAAATVAVAVGLRFLPFGGAIPAGEPLRVERLAGEAWVAAGVGGARQRALAVPGVVAPGEVIETSEGGRIALRTESGRSVRLAGATTLRLRDDGALGLERGAVYIDSGPGDGSPGTVHVHTPLGVVEEIGTQFEVRMSDDTLRVRLREGSVVIHRDEQEHRVTAGEQLDLRADGTVSRRPIPIHGPEWEWLSAVTAAPEFDGRSTRAFLEWVARERGLRLTFESDAVARAADQTILAGGVEGLTIEEALDVALPISRMTYRIEDGVLTVALD